MEDGVTTSAAEDRKPPDLQRLKRMVTEAQTLTIEARNQSLIDTDYYDGYQFTAPELSKLASRGQPDIVINRTRAAINGILGVTEQGKSEPRAFPRTPKDEESADVATDVLRFIADKNRFDRIKSDRFKDMLVPGSMAVLIGADGDLNITIEPIRWEELIYDPKSRRADFSDARYIGIAKWMYADDLAALYPKKREDIEAAINNGSLVGDQTYQDRPDNAGVNWIDRRQRRLMVIELYYRESGWKRCVFTAADLLEESDSPYKDDKGQSCNPIEAQSAYVDRNNNRYGAVRDMRGPQDEINKRRSKLLHLISVSQIQAVDPLAAQVNVDGARAEAARPDGVIPFGWQRVPTSDMARGQAELLQEAKGELERLGPNPAILGRQGADSSGRAVLARQQAGMVELAPLFGALEDWELRVYRQCWSRAKQFWTAPMFIRVTDDEDAPKFIGLNQPKGAPQPIIGPDGQPQVGEDGQPMTEEGPPLVHPDTYPSVIPANDNQYGQYAGLPHPMAGQPNPQAGQAVLGYKNQMAEMDVDITLDSMPDVANIQQEQFQDLVQLVGSNPNYATQVPFEIMLELSAVPHKRQIIDRLKKFGQEAGQGQQQQQQAQMQAAMSEMAAKIKVLETTATLNAARVDLTEAQTRQIGAETTLSAHAADSDAQLNTASMLAEHARADQAHEADLDNTRANTFNTMVQARETALDGEHQRSLPQPAAGASGA